MIKTGFVRAYTKSISPKCENAPKLSISGKIVCGAHTAALLHISKSQFKPWVWALTVGKADSVLLYTEERAIYRRFEGPLSLTSLRLIQSADYELHL